MKQLLALFLFLPFLVWSQSNFEKGEKLFQAKKYDEAQVILEGVLKSKPSDAKTLEYLGDIAAHNKSWQEAVKYYKKLKELKPNDANFYFKYGGALGMRASEVNKFKALGMASEVKESFEKAIELNPKHIQARWGLIEYYLHLPGIFGGSESKAISYSNELMQLSAVDGNLAKGRIEEYFERYNAAEKYYIKANEIGKSKTTFQKLYNLYLNKLKDAKKARELKQKFESS
ncbi:tetratricopeptide repeat protein [Flavobacterium sp. 270]|uniref:tetratricopeptide repeat protein n=1 Tax=Flavobacterium sp. 270 TaxID=2512114 RepID=UPI0010660953|nr:tetratricopeptide repeat protein [Flavobacterium sp. 270]TDW47051.1 tetratricopeptide repeat protein [Flavobacterium sp. 270]